MVSGDIAGWNINISNVSQEKLSNEEAQEAVKIMEYGHHGDTVRVDKIEIDEYGLQKGNGVWQSKQTGKRDVNVESDTKYGSKFTLEVGRTYPRSIFVPKLYGSIGFAAIGIDSVVDLVVGVPNIE